MIHRNMYYIFPVFRINPLSLVEILAIVIQQFQNKQEAITFLEKTETKVKSSNEAVALCKVLMGQILLDKLNDQEKAKKTIEEVEVMLDNADSVTTVHGRFYLLASRLYRLQGKHAEYYRTALRYRLYRGILWTTFVTAQLAGERFMET